MSLGAAGVPQMPQRDNSDQVLVAFAAQAQQNRLTVLVRIILAIPHLVVLWALGIAAEVVVVICWFAALILGRLSPGPLNRLAVFLGAVRRPASGGA
jgi:Domain of unknown function (DUF4389)